MNLPELCIRRPVMTTLLSVALCVFGIMTYLALPISDMPNTDSPVITVSASLPGASPETMASAVATPLENQLSTIAGIQSMASVSTLGSTQITIEFELSRNIDAAAQDVQTAIAAIQRRMPKDMPDPPYFRKTNSDDSPVLYLTLNSATRPLSEVTDYAETQLGQRISMIDGVAQVMVMGSQKYALRVRIDPRVLASRGIAINDIRTALANYNVNLPTGIIDGQYQAVTLTSTGQLDRDPEQFRNIIVAYRNNAPVRLGEVAEVVNSVQSIRSASWFYTAPDKGNRTVTLMVQKQPGTNTVEVVNRVKAILPAFQAQLPASIDLQILRDASLAVRESVHDVQFTLMLSIALVVLVIFLFLRTLTATIIPSIAIPMAMLGTFIVMYFCGYTLDNLSLLAITLSVGFVVDDAIVMLENIVRYMEQGMNVREAAFKGSREIGFTILSMTLSLVAVFLPIMFMGGLLGRLLHEFAVTITAAILVSGFVSLTLTPMLCSRFLKPHKNECGVRNAECGMTNQQTANQHTPPLASANPKSEIQNPKSKGFLSYFERAFSAMLRLYERTLRVSLRHKLITALIALVMAVLTVLIAMRLPRGFIPTDDQGNISVNVEAAQDISFASMARHMQAVSSTIMQNPAVDLLQTSVGSSSGRSTTNTGRIMVGLKPRAQRDDAFQVVNQLRRSLAAIPGIKAYPQVPPLTRIGAVSSKAQYQVALYGTDLDALYKTAPQIQARLAAIHSITDVNSDLLIASPQMRIDILRDRASALGITPQQIEDTLYSAYGTRQVSTIYTPTNQFYVILEVDDAFQQDPSALSLIYLPAANGKLIPLDSVATFTRDIGPLSISHLGQVPAVTLSFNLAPGSALSDATTAIRELLNSGVLPASVSYDFVGSTKAFDESTRGLGLLLILAVLVIYIVLGILYEDFVHPLTILTGLPAASFGALFTLYIFREELNIMGYVGIILLIGIVKKNAIMMIDFAQHARHTAAADGHERTAEESIFEACMVRFRPIMMTSFAALAAAVPIALGLGAGAESRRPLGLAVVGGLVVSQLLTLYITPTFYVYFDRLTTRLRRRKNAPVPVPLAESVPAK